MQTLVTKLQEIVRDIPDQVAMQIKTESGYRRYTYQDFYARALCVAYGLTQQGVQPGDRVAIVMENEPAWGMVYFGILMAGGTAVPVDVQSSEEDFSYYFAHSECKVVVVSEQSSSRSLLEESFDARSRGAQSRGNDRSVVTPDLFFEMQVPADFEPHVGSPEDIASIIYTSGTTGKPKGVMLTHANFYANYASVEELGYFSPPHNILSILPLHHAFPFAAAFLVPLFTKNRVTYISSLKQTDIVSAMQETGVTVLLAVPQFYVLLQKAIAQQLQKVSFFVRCPLMGVNKLCWWLRKSTGMNLSKYWLRRIHKKFGDALQFFACGGAKLDTEVELFLNQLGFCLTQGYGLTETAPGVTINPPSHTRIGSVGTVMPGVEVKIHEPDAQGVGEVIIRGSNVMQGYFKREAETREVLKDGWFFSGDLGYIDKDGYVYLTGRKKEIIVLSSGKNISPEEVEIHYEQSQYIKELCVFDVTENGETKLVAVVVPDFAYFDSMQRTNLYGIIKWDIENLSKQYPSYKHIMGFVLANDDLPRTRLGKLKRYLIEARYQGKVFGAPPDRSAYEPTEADQKLMQMEEYSAIVKIIKNMKSHQHMILPDDHLEIDLGFDSLSRVELFAAIEHALHVHLPEDILHEVFTVRQLVEAALSATIATGERTEKDWNIMLAEDPQESVRARIDLKPAWWANVLTLLLGWILYVWFKLYFRMKIRGAEHLPEDSVFMLCPNHACFLDAFFVYSSVPARLKLGMFFLGYAAYFEKSSIIRRLVKIGRIIPIDPAARLIDAMQACSYVLRRKKRLCIFPEGTRSIDGKLNPFKKGVGILAKEVQVPVVPVYIRGAHRVWPRTKKFPRPYPVEVIFGESKTPAELRKIGYAHGAQDDYNAIALGLQQVVEALGADYAAR